MNTRGMILCTLKQHSLVGKKWKMPEENRQDLASCLVQFGGSCSVVWWIFAHLQDLRSMKVGQVILQLHLDWGLDTDTQISSNKCKVDPSVNCWVRLWKLSKGVK